MVPVDNIMLSDNMLSVGSMLPGESLLSENVMLLYYKLKTCYQIKKNLK
jgi:hypothetical protein